MTVIVVSSGQVSSGNTLGSGMDMFVEAGGSAVAIMVDGGADLTISAGGAADSVTLQSGGAMHVAGYAALVHLEGGEVFVDGGTVSATTITSGGFMHCGSGGVAEGTNIGSQGTLYVSAGGMASDTSVTSAGSLWDYAGGTVISSVVTHSGFAIVSGGLTSDMSVQSAGGEYIYSGGSALFTQVSGGGMEFVFSGGVASNTVIDNGGLARIASGGALAGAALMVGGAIDLAFLAYSGGSASFDPNTDVLTVTEGARSATLQLAGTYTGEYFHLASDGLSGTDISVDGVPCYCLGTAILTEHGEVAVENLRIGDCLITDSGARRNLRWIGTRSYGGAFVRGNRHMLPVRIRAGALGDNRPHRDLAVSPLHAMFIDGVLIPAASLVNGVSIVQDLNVQHVEYFHLELDTHDILVAEGAASESYVDDCSRGMFHNAAAFERLYPNAARPPALYCAPRVEDGPALQRIRHRLRSIAA